MIKQTSSIHPNILPWNVAASLTAHDLQITPASFSEFNFIQRYNIATEIDFTVNVYDVFNIFLLYARIVEIVMDAFWQGTQMDNKI